MRQLKACLWALVCIWGPWCVIVGVPSTTPGGAVLARSETALTIWFFAAAYGFLVAVLFTILSCTAIALSPLMKD